VNAVGQVLVAQRFLDLLKAGTNPKIINITSEAGSISTMDRFRGYYYFGSKAAMNMFSRSMAWDPDTAGIITIASHPGWVRTDMGGSDADLSVSESAEGILKVIAGLRPEDNGKFLPGMRRNIPGELCHCEGRRSSSPERSLRRVYRDPARSNLRLNRRLLRRWRTLLAMTSKPRSSARWDRAAA